MPYILGDMKDFASFRLHLNEERFWRDLRESLKISMMLSISAPPNSPIFMSGVKEDRRSWVWFDNEKEALENRNARLHFYSMNELFIYQLEEIQ